MTTTSRVLNNYSRNANDFLFIIKTFIDYNQEYTKLSITFLKTLLVSCIPKEATI